MRARAAYSALVYSFILQRSIMCLLCSLLLTIAGERERGSEREGEGREERGREGEGGSWSKVPAAILITTSVPRHWSWTLGPGFVTG